MPVRVPRFIVAYAVKRSDGKPEEYRTDYRSNLRFSEARGLAREQSVFHPTMFWYVVPQEPGSWRNNEPAYERTPMPRPARIAADRAGF